MTDAAAQPSAAYACRSCKDSGLVLRSYLEGELTPWPDVLARQAALDAAYPPGSCAVRSGWMRFSDCPSCGGRGAGDGEVVSASTSPVDSSCPPSGLSS